MDKTLSLNEYIKRKPLIAWYVNDYSKLSEESILENILNNGTWDDFVFAVKTLGMKRCNEIFNQLQHKKRTNLRPQTINFFNLYFKRHAQ